MTDYEVNEAAMRDGIDCSPAPSCGTCQWWHGGRGGAGICGIRYRRSPLTGLEAAADCITGADDGTDCNDWREYEG